MRILDADITPPSHHSARQVVSALGLLAAACFCLIWLLTGNVLNGLPMMVALLIPGLGAMFGISLIASPRAFFLALLPLAVSCAYAVAWLLHLPRVG